MLGAVARLSGDVKAAKLSLQRVGEVPVVALDSALEIWWRLVGRPNRYWEKG